MGQRSEQTFSQRRHTGGQQVHEKMLSITNYQGNAKQNHNEMSQLKWLSSKRQDVSVGEDVEKRETCALLMGM